MSIMQQEIISQQNVLENCYTNNIEMVEKLAKYITDNSITNIEIVARGSSNNACVYFKYLCEIFTPIRVNFVNPSTITLFNGNLNCDNTILLAVSQGGRGEDLQIVVNNAKKNGVYTVSITNDHSSPLSQKTDLSLCMQVGLEQSMAATKTFCAEMLILGMLAHQLHNGSTKALAGISNTVKEVLNCKQSIANYSQKLANVNNLFVLSRGYCLAVAKEACCKLQETCFVNANAFATSDFMHGPFALIEQSSKVLVLAPSDETLPSTKDMLNKLSQQKANIYLLSSDKQLCKQYDGLYVPTVDKDTMTFSFAVAVQLLACQLSTLKGVDPDTSRNLNKYTVTI